MGQALTLLSLPIAACFKQNHGMDKPPGRSATPKSLLKWAITPPQSYAIYLLALFLVAGLSFYVGTMKSKKPVGGAPPPVSTPRN